MRGNSSSDGQPPLPEEHRNPTSQIVALAGAVVITAVLVGLLLATDSSTTGYVSTLIGEQRPIELPDGSLIVLNTSSGIRTRTDGQTLSIELLRGEVLFDMRPNPHRHLIVSARNLRITDTGTRFAVQLVDNGRVKVTVQEGNVRLFGGRLAPLSLDHDQQALVDDEATQVNVRKEVTPEEIARQLSWRQGLLEFHCTSLSDAVSELNRYNSMKIEVDPRISDVTIGGGFSTTDPKRFVEKLPHLDPRIRWEVARNAYGESVLRLYEATRVPPELSTADACTP